VQVNLQDIFDMLSDVRDRFQREEDQGLRQHDMHKATVALAGKDACDRIKTDIELRTAWLPAQAALAEPTPMPRKRKAG